MAKKIPTKASREPEKFPLHAHRLVIAPNMSPAPFGQMLRTARLASRQTQVEVAKRMKVTQGAVATLESGRVKPTLDTLARFASAIGWELAITFEFSKG